MTGTVAPAPMARRARLRLGGVLARLDASKLGNATVEFALCLPVLLTLGMYGTEVAHMATVNMQVSQMALSVADNASRLGQTDNSAVTPTVTEADISSIMKGAIEQGSSIDFLENGRIILTSLEKDESTGRQYIHWQRCIGQLAKSSAYGNDGDNNGMTGEPLAGLGKPGKKISAQVGTSVMFAEVFYDYNGLFGKMFGTNMQFKHEAAFLTRDDRNLTPGVTGSGGTASCA